MMEGVPLARRLGVADAVMIGVGSMVGAGLFAAFGPAARAAGAGLLLGLVIAFVVALCNATSSAQLAAQYPTSGGTYLYGRERLGEWPGFLAGWGFVIGKTASCAAMAMTAAAYAIPGERSQHVGAALAVIALTAVNLRGISRTAAVTRVLVVIVLALLAVFVAAMLVRGGPQAHQLSEGWWGGAYGVLQSAGLLFFAFAGYARIATLGEEVADPVRTIPRAILIALVSVGVLYAVVASVLLATLGARDLADASAPLAAAAELSGWSALGPMVRIAATLAALGALLGLIAGVSRTMLAMAREGDLPRVLAVIEPQRQVPQRAEIVVGAVVLALVLVADVRAAIGFSSFGVLLYYAIANASAWTQDAPHRRYPRAMQAIGLVACLTLMATLPWTAVITGLSVLAVGVAGRLVARRLDPHAA